MRAISKLMRAPSHMPIRLYGPWGCTSRIAARYCLAAVDQLGALIGDDVLDAILGLKPEDRLIGAEIPGQRDVAEGADVEPGNAKERRPGPLRLDGDDGGPRFGDHAVGAVEPGQALDGLVLEQRGQRDLFAEGRLPSMLIICAASSEWPPRSKKLSWTPTRGTPRTSTQIAASFSSIGRARRRRTGPTLEAGPIRRGQRRRSILPFARQRQRSRSTIAAGTMYSGSFARRKALSSAHARPTVPAAQTT